MALLPNELHRDLVLYLRQSSGTFTPAGNMTTYRMFPTATSLPNGKVLIVGYGNGGELYDPVAGTFRTTGNTAPWSDQSVTALPDGRVLIAGGYIFRHE